VPGVPTPEGLGTQDRTAGDNALFLRAVASELPEDSRAGLGYVGMLCSAYRAPP